ncbi:hypothetical protein Tco_0601280, partial [Tanacetum coccineum]
MSTPVFVDPKSSTQADGAQSSRVPIPLPKDPYEAIRQAYLVETDTKSEPFEDLGTESPESPHIVVSHVGHVEESESSKTSGVGSTSSDSTTPLSPDHPLTHDTPDSVPPLRRTARMAVRVQPMMSPGCSARIAEVAAMSDVEFRKRFRSPYEISPSPSPTLPVRKRGFSEDAEDEGPAAGDEDLGMRGESFGLGEDEVVPEVQQQAAPVVETTVGEPSGLGYGALRRRELAAEEDQRYSTFEIGQGSGLAPEPERSERVSAFRQPALTTWTDPEDGTVYIDVPTYPPPAPPVQTPPSPEWTSGSLPISPSHSDVPSPISSPLVSLTVPSPVATPTATIPVDEDQFIEIGAQLEFYWSILQEHTLRLDAMPPTLFTEIDRDVRELYTRSGAVRDEIFSQRVVLRFSVLSGKFSREWRKLVTQRIGCVRLPSIGDIVGSDGYAYPAVMLRCVKSKVCDWYWKKKDVTQGDWVEMDDGAQTDTETPESPLAIAPPILPSKSTPPVLVPILRRTACMAVRVPHAMSSGLSASMAEVAAMSESALLEDSEEDDDEEDEEIEESMDSDSVSEDAEDEDDEGHGRDDESHALVVGTTVSAPLGLGYGALRRRELALEESNVYSTFEVGQGSRSALVSERSERVSAFRQPTLTTWTDPEDGMIYIDIPDYPPPAPPVQTPPLPEYTSGSLPISPSPSDVPSPVSLPIIPLTVPSPVATPTAVGAVREEIFSQRYWFRSLEYKQERVAVTFGAIWRPVLALEAWAGLTDAQRAALWHTISDVQGENQDLRAVLPCVSALRLFARDRADTHFLNKEDNGLRMVMGEYWKEWRGSVWKAGHIFDYADGAQSSRVPVPLPKDPYEAIKQAYLDGTNTESEPFEDPIDTKTPESPLAIAPPIPLSKSTPPVLVPILRRTARMAVRVPHAMSSGLSTGIAEVAAMSESAFRKRFRSSYESSPSVSPPDLPSRKRYHGTSELVEDSEEDNDEEDKEIEESMDSDSVSVDAEDEGPTTEDEDPAAEDEGLTTRVYGLSMGDEGYGLDDVIHGIDDEGHSVESDGLGLEEEKEAVPGGQQQAASIVGTTVSAPLGLGYGVLRRRELALEEGDVYSTFEVGQGFGSAPESERPERVSAFRQPTLTTWTDPKDGMIYIDIPDYPPPAPPVQTPPLPEDIGELFTRSVVVREEIFSKRYQFRSLEYEQERVAVIFGAIWRLVLALEAWAGENQDLRLQLAEERRARLELAEVVD